MPRYVLKAGAAVAYGHVSRDGGRDAFVVEKGSTALRQGPAKVKRDSAVRDRLNLAGVLVDHPSFSELLIFASDHAFRSPSSAGGVIKDGNSSGPQSWINEATGLSLKAEMDTGTTGVTVSLIVDALSQLGGEAHIGDITALVASTATPPLPVDVGAAVRARIQERCAEAQSYKGGPDLFESVHGVHARQGIWRLKSDPLSPANPDGMLDGTEDLIEAPEGKRQLRIHLRRERSEKLVRAFKTGLTDLRCIVCDFDFEASYGEQGKGFIEAHHTRPVSSLEDGEKTTIDSLVPLCSNCHRMVHRNGLMDWRDLKKILRGQA